MNFSVEEQMEFVKLALNDNAQVNLWIDSSNMSDVSVFQRV